MRGAAARALASCLMMRFLWSEAAARDTKKHIAKKKRRMSRGRPRGRGRLVEIAGSGAAYPRKMVDDARE